MKEWTTISLPKHDRDVLRAVANHEGLTYGEAIRQLIEESHNKYDTTNES